MAPAAAYGAPLTPASASVRLSASTRGVAGHAGETVAVTIASGALIAIAAWPAFHAYFFGEAFLYLGQYWAAHERFWRALFSPSDLIFFKPVCFAASLPWYFLLPVDQPWPFHVRNYLFTVGNVALLHRVALRLVTSRTARALAIGLFAASKVHLTTIGYLMIFDSIVMLMCVLATALFTLRWRASGSAWDRRAALACCALATFTKDYGVAAVAIVVAVVATTNLDPHRDDAVETRQAWVRWGMPLAVLVLAKIALRWTVVGSLPWDNPWYAPRLSIGEAGRKLLMLGSAGTNLSFARHERTGASGVGTVIAAATRWTAPAIGTLDAADWIDAAAAVALVALVATTWRTTRLRARTVLVPAVWIAVFTAPTFLVGNLQVYYAYEPLAGAALLLGVVLARAEPRLVRAWIVAVAIVAVAGVASNRAATYDWQYAARGAETIRAPVLDAYADVSIDAVTFVTTRPEFWRWTLTADNKAPMVQALMRRPALKVWVAAPGEPTLIVGRALVIDADAGHTRISGPEPVSRRGSSAAREGS